MKNTKYTRNFSEEENKLEDNFYHPIERILNRFKNKEIGYSEAIFCLTEFISPLLSQQKGKILEEFRLKLEKELEKEKDRRKEAYKQGRLAGLSVHGVQNAAFEMAKEYEEKIRQEFIDEIKKKMLDIIDKAENEGLVWEDMYLELKKFINKLKI